MRQTSPSFATRKPTFRGQKNKYQNQDTKHVPLPSIPWVIPKDDLFKKAGQFPSPTDLGANNGPQSLYNN